MSLPIPAFLAPLLTKPVAVFGAEAQIYDAQAGRGAIFNASAAREHALVIFSPGFAPEHAWLKLARAAGLMCVGEMDFASLFWRGRLVAITGTNGKTTLTEFLTHALRSVGRDARATGNIGDPFSRLAVLTGGGGAESFAICEVSSFQAETFEHFRAEAALWTNFAEDHLERHPGLESYFGAKWKLLERTRPGGVFIGSTVERFARKFDRPLAHATVVPTENRPADPRLARTVFAEYPQRENFLLAAAWWRAAGFDDAALVAAARTFKLGRHRLSRVTEVDGVTYWNDSKATNFHAVEAALTGFSAPVVLIAGGKSKGGDLAGFVHRIAPRVKHAVLIGETSAELAFQCSAFRVAHSTTATLEEAVRRAAEIAQDGEHVLLSPGFASFDMFRNYEDRGDQFERLVRESAASAPNFR